MPAFTDIEVLIGLTAVAFFLGVGFGPWLKDKVLGVPSDVRAAVSEIEAHLKEKVYAAQAEVLGGVKSAAGVPPPVIPPPAVVPAAPVAPVVPPGPAA